mmetsp:Transcript_33342/g.60075  ORF Transcript_33342/g.60075 Transcript_33342/m.60075 type:complete len:294 (-) Transcript_33342:53-934(-)
MMSNNNMRPSTNQSHPTPNIDKIHLSRRVQHAITGIVILIISYIIPPYPIGFLLLTLATAAFYHVHRKRVHEEAWDKWYLESFGALLRDHERGEWEDVKVADNGGTSNKHNNNKQQSHDSPMYKRRRKTNPALPGAFYFLLGTSLSTLLFPTVVARTSLLVLSVADPMAGLVGAWFSDMGYNFTWKQLLQRFQGKDKSSGMGEGGPSIAGSIACAGSTILCTHVYIHSIVINTNSTIPTGNESLSFNSRICIGIITSLTEAMAGRHLPMVGTMADDNLLIPLVVGSLICWLSE